MLSIRIAIACLDEPNTIAYYNLSNAAAHTSGYMQDLVSLHNNDDDAISDIDLSAHPWQVYTTKAGADFAMQYISTTDDDDGDDDKTDDAFFLPHIGNIRTMLGAMATFSALNMSEPLDVFEDKVCRHYITNPPNPQAVLATLGLSPHTVFTADEREQCAAEYTEYAEYTKKSQRG